MVEYVWYSNAYTIWLKISYKKTLAFKFKDVIKEEGEVKSFMGKLGKLANRDAINFSKLNGGRRVNHLEG